MRPLPIIIIGGAIAAFVALLYRYAYANGLPVLFPAGSVGVAERDLILHTTFMMLIVIVPVYLLILFIGWRYRAENTKASYTPDWEHSRMEELVWWAIPFEIVLVLGALTWGATHDLAPEKALSSTEAPYTVQVVALPWKWLFIYPEDGTASVNELAIPAGRPVEFQITADAPMNSFWIPALGGQMYAMTGMTTHLNLRATDTGTYEGRSANYSGEGFADMTFPVEVLSENDFQTWLTHAQSSETMLTSDTYATLATPGTSTPVRYYGHMTIGFQGIVDHSMAAPSSSSNSAMPEMDSMAHMH